MSRYFEGGMWVSIHQFLLDHPHFAETNKDIYTLKQEGDPSLDVEFSSVLHVFINKKFQVVYLAGSVESKTLGFCTHFTEERKSDWVTTIMNDIRDNSPDSYIIKIVPLDHYVFSYMYKPNNSLANLIHNRERRDKRSKTLTRRSNLIIASIKGDQSAGEKLHAKDFKLAALLLYSLIEANCFPFPQQIKETLYPLVYQGYEEEQWNAFKALFEKEINDEALKDPVFAFIAETVCELDSNQLNHISYQHKWKNETFNIIQNYKEYIQKATPMPPSKTRLDHIPLEVRMSYVEDHNHPLEERLFILWHAYQNQDINTETFQSHLFSLGLFTSPYAVIERRLEEKLKQ